MSIKGWIRKTALEATKDFLADLKGFLAQAEDLQRQVTGLAREVQDELHKLKAATEEIDHRIERGNQIWRNIRAAERRQEILEEEEEWDEVPRGDEGGSDPRQMQLLPEDMGPTPGDRDFHLAVAAEIAQRIASGL